MNAENRFLPEPWPSCEELDEGFRGLINTSIAQGLTGGVSWADNRFGMAI